MSACGKQTTLSWESRRLWDPTPHEQRLLTYRNEVILLQANNISHLNFFPLGSFKSRNQKQWVWWLGKRGRHFLEANNSGETCHRVGIAKRWGVQPLCAAGQSQADHPRDLPEWDRWFNRGPCGTCPCICLSLGCPLFLFSFLSVPCHLSHAGLTQEHGLSGSGILGSISEYWSLSFISKSGYEWGLYALFWPFQ